MEPKNEAGKIVSIQLRRVARISAWRLFITVVVLVVSGWGITQTGVIYNVTFGLIDRRLADAIHRATILPLAIFFLLHVLINVKLVITSKHSFLKWLGNIALIIIGAGILGVVVFMEYFRLGG